MEQYIVDAFTDRVFGGNQAAVCLPRTWPEDETMRNVAKENNFSETAFAVREGEEWRLRWFTPGGEVDFCGHATLGTAYALFRFHERDRDRITFRTQAGTLTVLRREDLIEMDFPAYAPRRVEVTEEMAAAAGVMPLEAYLDRDLMLVLPDARAVRSLRPDMDALMGLEGLLTAVTAPSDDGRYDCVSRVFGPKLAIGEDPVTGSTHCMIAPYWARRLSRQALSCLQASPRGGALRALVRGDRVLISGKAVLFSRGRILED